MRSFCVLNLCLLLCFCMALVGCESVEENPDPFPTIQKNNSIPVYIANNLPDTYSQFLSALQVAGLTTSDNKGQLDLKTHTLFVPDNTALEKLPPAIFKMENVQILTHLLSYHILTIDYTRDNLLSSNRIITLYNNTPILIENKTLKTDHTNSIEQHSARITNSDAFVADNGHIFTVDNVLIPNSLEASIDALFMFNLNFHLDTGVTLPDGETNPRAVGKGSIPILPKLIKTNSRILRWYTDAGFVTEYQYTPITSDIKLYPKWETHYTVTLNLHKTPWSTERIVKQVRGEQILKLPTDPVNTGKSFAGWYTDQATTESNKYTPSKVTEDILLYAKWIDPPFIFKITAAENTGIDNDVEADISVASKTITIPMASEITVAELLTLKPTITGLEQMSTIKPDSGLEQNFQQPLKYTITDKNNKTTEYQVKIKVTDKTQLQALVTAILNAVGNTANLNFIDCSLVTDMSNLFKNKTNFNGDIRAWDISKVTTMEEMFRAAASFNQPIGGWDVSSVTNMAGTFREANSFNKPLDHWDVGQVTNMSNMFDNASNFNQDLVDWKIDQVTNFSAIFNGATAMETSNKPRFTTP